MTDICNTIVRTAIIENMYVCMYVELYDIYSGIWTVLTPLSSPQS